MREARRGQSRVLPSCRLSPFNELSYHHCQLYQMSETKKRTFFQPQRRKFPPHARSLTPSPCRTGSFTAPLLRTRIRIGLSGYRTVTSAARQRRPVPSFPVRLVRWRAEARSSETGPRHTLGENAADATNLFGVPVGVPEKQPEIGTRPIQERFVTESGARRAS